MLGLQRLSFALFILQCAGFRALVLGDVELASPFQNHMVLQRDQEIPVWGWAEPGEKINVQILDQSVSKTAGSDGRWKVTLEPLAAGGPHRLIVQGRNRIELADVLVGEVWLASGQSNMAMPVSRALNPERERTEAQFPEIRMMTVSRRPAEQPESRCEGKWIVCAPETVSQFSATAYFFAREIHQSLDVPVGILNASYGGTAVEAWTSRPAQEEVAELSNLLDSWDSQVHDYDAKAAELAWKKQLETWNLRVRKAKAAGKPAPRRPRRTPAPTLNQNRPANLFNGMIHPLIPYAVRGVIWYQGERNTRESPELYSRQLETLISDWRSRWRLPDLPFAWAQLPNYTARQKMPVQTTGWVIVQEQMLRTLRVPHTGMAVTIDIGEASDIHPKNKQEVGRRLSLWARSKVYGTPLVSSGPSLRKSSMERLEGKTVVRLVFDHVGEGLGTADGKPPRGFAIAGKDGVFHWADAEIETTRDGVRVWHREVSDPVSVRYSWAPNPIGNLVNSAGLPASPVRTDSLPLSQSAP